MPRGSTTLADERHRAARPRVPISWFAARDCPSGSSWAAREYYSTLRRHIRMAPADRWVSPTDVDQGVPDAHLACRQPARCADADRAHRHPAAGTNACGQARMYEPAVSLVCPDRACRGQLHYSARFLHAAVAVVEHDSGDIAGT